MPTHPAQQVQTYLHNPRNSGDPDKPCQSQKLAKFANFQDPSYAPLLPVKVVCVEVCETGWQEGSAEFWVCDKYHGMPTIHGGDELEGKRGDEI